MMDLAAKIDQCTSRLILVRHGCKYVYKKFERTKIMGSI